jgi:hypothetical protein
MRTPRSQSENWGWHKAQRRALSGRYRNAWESQKPSLQEGGGLSVMGLGRL